MSRVSKLYYINEVETCSINLFCRTPEHLALGACAGAIAAALTMPVWHIFLSEPSLLPEFLISRMTASRLNATCDVRHHLTRVALRRCSPTPPCDSIMRS
jgi:hypothetical protein